MTIDISGFPAHLLVAYAAYFIGTASPGPSNVAIMGTAMNAGRIPALVLASGILAGSLLWGLLAALGLSTVLATYSSVLVAMKILGGLYLLWLAWKSARSAISRNAAMASGLTPNPSSHFRTFLRGATMHLTNPKAIFVWLSIVTLALPPNAKNSDALLVVAGCSVIGAGVFGSYAIAFSAPFARFAYQALRRWLDGALAMAFGYAGIRMLLFKAPGT